MTAGTHKIEMVIRCNYRIDHNAIPPDYLKDIRWTCSCGARSAWRTQDEDHPDVRAEVEADADDHGECPD